MNKKYAIFDMDGTLVDSMKYWKNLGREYLEKNGITENLDDIIEKIKPMTMSESAELFAESFLPEKTPKEVEREMNAMIEEYYCSAIPAKPGVIAYLEKMHQASVKMCVASATDETLMKACLTRLGVAKYFEFLLSCETVGAGKRQPDVYFEAARRLGALPEKIAVYEDAFYAVKTAKEAGLYVIGVYDKYHRKENWEAVCEMADELIIDWEEG